MMLKQKNVRKLSGTKFSSVRTKPYRKEKTSSGNVCETKKSAELYEIYLEKNFVPRKFRTKLPDNCTEREKQLLRNLAIDRVKHEIIILKNRSSEFKDSST